MARTAALLCLLFATACGGNEAAGGSGGAAASGSGGTAAGGGGSGGAGDECITDTTAKPDHVFACDDLNWNVSVPEACLEMDCGLIVDVHGFSMSGRMENNNTGLVALGQKHGYIVINPNARPGPPLSAWTPIEDDGKVFDFAKRVMKVFHTDPKRFHFTGFSQGGDMTWRFICNHSDVVASAAPAAFGYSKTEYCFSKGNSPPREMPILYMHGTKDAVVPFSNAEVARDTVVSVLTMNQTDVVSSDDAHQWTRYKNAEATVFEFIQHDYTGDPSWGDPAWAGHCFPGSSDPGLEPNQYFPFKCEQPAAFVWGDEVMKFFIAHPMP